MCLMANGGSGRQRITLAQRAAPTLVRLPVGSAKPGPFLLCEAGDMSPPAPRMLVERRMQYVGIARLGLSVLPFSCYSNCHVFNSQQHMQLWRLEPNLGK